MYDERTPPLREQSSGAKFLLEQAYFS